MTDFLTPAEKATLRKAVQPGEKVLLREFMEEKFGPLCDYYYRRLCSAKQAHLIKWEKNILGGAQSLAQAFQNY